MTVDRIHASAINRLEHLGLGSIKLAAEVLDSIDQLVSSVEMMSVEIGVQQLGDTSLNQRHPIKYRTGQQRVGSCADLDIYPDLHTNNCTHGV